MSTTVAAQSRRCDGPRYRDFDFWLGRWDVFSGAEKVADVVITSELDGCVIGESYVDTTGLRGTSLSSWDSVSHRWRQTWLTNRGQAVVIEGGRKGDGISLAGWMHDGTSESLVKVTWAREGDDVREIARRSADGGRTWTTWFDLSFRRSDARANDEGLRERPRTDMAVTPPHAPGHTTTEGRLTMSHGKETGISSSTTVRINAPIARVWEALTVPAVIKQWFFGTDTITDWSEGSPIVHRGEFNGKAYEDKGVILRFEPPRLLAHTHWSSMSGRPDQPENYERVIYSLEQKDGATELTVSEENLPSEEAKAASLKAWDGALSSLKKLLEK